MKDRKVKQVILGCWRVQDKGKERRKLNMYFEFMYEFRIMKSVEIVPGGEA
jgi:hypothetical protein